MATRFEIMTKALTEELIGLGIPSLTAAERGRALAMDRLCRDPSVDLDEALNMDANFNESDHPRGEGGKFGHTEAIAHHEKQKSFHEGEAKSRGENLFKPGAGSHANASSLHGSAAYYHNAAMTNPSEDYEKKSKRGTQLADAASKKIAKQGASYNAPKENDTDLSDGLTTQQRQAQRGAHYLSQRFIGPRG